MLERKITYYRPSGACWRISNDYFELDVDDITGVMQGLFLKNDFNDANFMGNEENTATDVAWRGRYVKDMNDRPPMYGWTGDIFLKTRREGEPEDKLRAMYTMFSDDIRNIECTEKTISVSYRGNSEYTGGLRDIDVISSYRLDRDRIEWVFCLKNTAPKPITIGELGLPMVLNTGIFMGLPQNGFNHRNVKHQKHLNEYRFEKHYLAAGHSSCYSAVRYGGIGDRLMIVPTGDTFVEVIGEEGEYGHDSMMKTQGTLLYLYSKSAVRVPYENQHTELLLQPGEEKAFSFLLLRAKDLRDLKDKMYKNGKIDVRVLPGMVLPSDGEGKMLVRSHKEIHSIVTDKGIFIEETGVSGARHFYKIRVSEEGPLKVQIHYGENEWTTLVFYGTPPLEQLINKRADFIRKNQQVTDPEDPVRYSFRSWDNVLERMDDVDMVNGLGTCYIGGGSDTNFAPPLFLSAKNIFYPNQEEITALDNFVEKFLYGILQDKETFRLKNGIYDNYQTYERLKGKRDFRQIEKFLIIDDEGKETTWRRWDVEWRIYDYPHAYNVYYAMYRIAKYSGFKVSQAPEEYLFRAYKTAMAKYLDSTYDSIIQFRAYQNHPRGNYPESHAPLGSFGLYDLLRALEDEEMHEERETIIEKIKSCSGHFVEEEYPFSSEYLIPGANTNSSPSYVIADIVNCEKLKDTVVRTILSTKGPFPRWYSYCAQNKFIGRYTTSLHAFPLLKRYEETGDDYMLQMAYGSLFAHWCCVDSEGKGYNSRDWRFNPIGRDDPRYNWYSNDARSSELGIGLNCNLRYLGSALVFDEDFGLFGYGCNVSEIEDFYEVEPWSGFGFKTSIIPLSVKMETFNIKLGKITINKNKSCIEIDIYEAVPGLRDGILIIKGLDPGRYWVSSKSRRREFSVSMDGLLTIKAVPVHERVQIAK